ncbi:MAG: hypothetical protein ABJE95_15340 [Byssovorax sp.]
MEPSSPTLVSESDVMAEIQRQFGAGAEAGLKIRVYGAPEGGEASAEAFREMLASLQMYDDRYRVGGTDQVMVDPPTRAALTRGLSVLGRVEHQKRVLDHILTTFGRRLIDPLARILDTTPEGALTVRLGTARDLLLAQIADLKLTPESQHILTTDINKLLTPEYLAMVAEHEERVQRPQVKALAQQILRLLGATFHRAMGRWPDHAEQIAAGMARRFPPKVRLQDVPGLLRTQVTQGVEEFLWVETSTEIEGALGPLFASHRGLIAVPPPRLDRSVYREFAEACWTIIVEHC